MSGRSHLSNMSGVDSIEAMCAAHASVSHGGRFAAGTIFGDWRITAFIGHGGNGEVYCAEHVHLATPAAVKVLIRDEERARIRFEREAKLLARLKSSAFPRFFAYGEANGAAYLAMELLEPGELPTGDHAVAKFMLKVCDAVGELHALGYVHRDIKPSNILWRMAGARNAPKKLYSEIGHAEGNREAAHKREPPRGCGRVSLPVPVLSDLGLVKELDPVASQTSQPDSPTLGGVGTPGYGAPEQMERGESTEASDIHALGVLVDQCFSGNPPRVWKHIIERATSSIPARRYPSVNEFVHAIRWRNLWRNIGKVLLMLFLVGLVVDIVIVAVVVWLW